MLHVFALAGGLWSAFSAQAGLRLSSAKFRRPLFTFILFFLLVVFLRLSSRYILVNLLGKPFVEHPLFVLLATPLRVLVEAGMVLFFLKTLWAIRGGNIPRWLQQLLAGTSAAFGIAYGYALAELARAPQAARLALINRVFDAAVLLAVLAPAGYVFLSRGRLADTRERATLEAFAGLYLAGFAFLPMVIWLPAPAGTLMIALCYIYISLCPVIWLRFFYPYYRESIELQSGNPENWGRLAGLYGLTDREMEIVRLLMKGKSNQDIGTQLFISRHTVRNHLHNIFDKMDVKSRGQLTFRVREELKDP